MASRHGTPLKVTLPLSIQRGAAVLDADSWVRLVLFVILISSSPVLFLCVL